MQNKIATESFKNGFNCAQSIVSAFAPEMGISRELSLRLASGLGGGIHGKGGACGAVVGSLIILGLFKGVDQNNNPEAKAEYGRIADTFSEQFLQKFPSLNCRELLVSEAGSLDLAKEMKERGELRDYCTRIVKHAARILEQMLSE